MTHTPFHLRLQLRNSFSYSSSFAPLDGKLAGIFLRYFFEEHEWPAAHEQLPIAKINGVPCASLPYHENLHLSHHHAYVSSVRYAELEPFKDHLIPNAKDDSTPVEPKPVEQWSKKEREDFATRGKQPTIGKKIDQIVWNGDKQGGFNHLSSKAHLTASFIHFFGVTTDLPLLKQIIQYWRFYGYKGHGIIQKAEVVAVPNGVNGIVDRHGHAMRPIPVDSGIEVAPNSIITETGAFPAYSQPENLRVCYVPNPTLNSWTSHQLKKEFLS